MTRSMWGLAVWFVLQACSPPEPATRTFVVGVDRPWERFDPMEHGSATEAYVNELLTPAPVRTRFDGQPTFESRYIIDWEWSGDWTTLTARLDDGLTWDDGTPLLAEHFAHTYKRGLARGSTALMASYLDDLEHVEALDATHIRWTFSVPQDPDTIWSVLHHGATHPGPAAEDGLPPAYGPWSMVSQEPGRHILLEQRAPTHLQAIERLAFRFLPDEDTRVRHLLAGQIQAAEVTSFHHLRALTEPGSELTPYPRGWKRSQFVAWNLEDPKFSDVRVRRALTMALDIPGMIEDLDAQLPDAFPLATQMRSTVSPSHKQASLVDHPLLPHDPEAARALLAEAGWGDANGDGWLDREGVPFRFVLMTTSDSPLRLSLAQIAQASWARIGVQVDVRPLEPTSMYGLVERGAFEAALASLNATPDADLRRVWGVTPAGALARRNYSRYRDPEVQALLDQQAQANDLATSHALSRQAQARIYDDQPFTFLLWTQTTHVIHRDITHVSSGFLAPYDQVESWTWREPTP